MRFLLATDGSEYSEGAARFLTRFDFSTGDEIMVLHVIAEVPYEDDYRAQVKQFIKRAAPGILRTASDILKPVKAKVTTREEDGYPDATIMEIAVDADVDLIVMGARGIRGMKAFFLGSSTRSVVINSAKPVLVSKPVAWSREGGMRILFATDGSEPAKTTGGLLKALPLRDDTEVKIINIAGSVGPDIPGGMIAETDERMKETLAKIQTGEAQRALEVVSEAERFLGNRFPNIGKVIEKGDPAAGILGEAEKWKADVVAVGSRGLRGVKGMIGSVSRRVLGHAGCAVLVGGKAAGR